MDEHAVVKRTCAALLLALGLVSQCPTAQADFEGWITAYSYGTTTASGRPVARGMVACGDWLAFGSRIAISGLTGTFECWDRGGAIFGTRLDIYEPDYFAAIQWGRQWRSWWVIDG